MTWSLLDGIARQWDTYDVPELDDDGNALRVVEGTVADQFKDYWADPDDNRYDPLHLDLAQPTPPGPYCVVEVLDAEPESHMSGTTSGLYERQIVMPTVQFTVHAKDTDSTSGYEIATRLARIVADAFDPGNQLILEGDCHVNTIRGPRLPAREQEEEWQVVLRYDFRIDSEYKVLTE
jgi:hypothetical protein